MQDLFNKQQVSILKLLNNHRSLFDIPHIKNEPIVKVFPNGVAQREGKNLKWYFWGKDVITDELFKANFLSPQKYKEYKFAWQSNSFTSGAGDGYSGQTSTVWATVRNNTDGNDTDYTLTTMRIIGEISGANYFIYRGFLPFNTASINGSTVVSATLQVVFTALGAGTADDIYIVTTTQASNTVLANADYDQVGTTAQSNSVLGTSGGVGTYSQALNATGISNINVVGGYTKFGLRHNKDFNNTTPVGLSDMSIGTSENATPGNRPLLTVVTQSGNFLAFM